MKNLCRHIAGKFVTDYVYNCLQVKIFIAALHCISFWTLRAKRSSSVIGVLFCTTFSHHQMAYLVSRGFHEMLRIQAVSL